MAVSKKRSSFGLFCFKIFIWVLAFIHIYPILLILLSALKTKAEISRNPAGLPQKITFVNFVNAFEKIDYFRSLFNTILITAISVFFILFLSSAAAYSIARKDNSFYRKLYLFFLISLIVPFQMTMIPLFKLMNNLSLINTYIGIIFIYLGSKGPFAIFFYTGFIKTVPKELEEAALIDGCGIYRSYFFIILPLLKPAISTIGILEAFSIWNDFLMPMLFLPRREMRTLVPQIASFVGQYYNDWSSIFACVFLIIYPMLIVYLIAQKSITKGITAGAVKA